jgi:hypothetical protein
MFAGNMLEQKIVRKSSVTAAVLDSILAWSTNAELSGNFASGNGSSISS